MKLDNIIYEFYNSYGREVGVPMYNEIVTRTIREIPKNNFDKNDMLFFIFRLQS